MPAWETYAQVLPASFFVWNYPQLFGKQRGSALDAGRMQTVLRVISAAAASAKHEKEMSECAREARFRDAYDDKHDEEPVLPESATDIRVARLLAQRSAFAGIEGGRVRPSQHQGARDCDGDQRR
jgi:hypothetical protein